MTSPRKKDAGTELVSDERLTELAHLVRDTPACVHLANATDLASIILELQSLRAAHPADRDALEAARQIVAAADDVASSQGVKRRSALKRLGVAMANEYGIIRMARALSSASQGE